MTIKSETDVLILGAGPTGMTAALTLERAGVKAMIIDKRAETRQYSQAAILWPRTLEVLDLLGIVEEWRPKSLPLASFNLDLDGQITSLEFQVPNSPFPQPWGVGQDVTEKLLEAAVLERDIDLHRSIEATSIELSDSGAKTKLHLPDGTETVIESKWVVGCEGSNSLVREAAGIQREGAHNPGVQLIQGDVRIRGPLALDPSRGYLFSVAAHESMLVVPQSIDGHFRVLLTVPDTGEKEPPTLEYLQSRAQQIVPGLELYDPSWLNRFRVQHQIATTFRQGRAFIAGDAAHVWVPIGGQGMNVAMQDAFDLGWKLGGVVAGQIRAEVLESYTRERHPIGKSTVAYTEKAYGAILDPNGLVAKLGRRLLPQIIPLSFVNEIVLGRLGQLDFSYPQSELVEDHGGTDGPKAGERAPEAWVNIDGKTTRLFDLYRIGQWTILLWDPISGQMAQLSALLEKHAPLVHSYVVDTTREGGDRFGGLPLIRDVGQFAKRAFGVTKPAVHVIRPDGVIGFRGNLNSDQIGLYLSRNLVS